MATPEQIAALARVLARAQEDNDVFRDGQTEPEPIAECDAQDADIESCRELLRELRGV